MTISAVVRHAPIPDIAPGDLIEVLTAVVDQVGRVSGWELNFGAVLGRTGRHTIFDQFRSWRECFETVYTLGSAAEVHAFRAHALALAAAVSEPLEAFSGVTFDGDDLRGRRLSAVEVDLGRVRALIAASDETGWGLVDVSPRPPDMPVRRGIARSLLALHGEEELTEGYGATTSIGPTGLVMRRDGHDDIVVSSYELVGIDVVAYDDRGEAVTLADPQGRVLAWLVPEASKVQVRRVPLTTVWSAALSGLHSAIVRARTTGQAVLISDDTTGGAGPRRVC